MDEINEVKSGPNDALGCRCAKCKFRVAVDGGGLESNDYCSNPENQKTGLGVLTTVWRQTKELYEHNILTHSASKSIENAIKSGIDYIQDYGIPLNTPYGQRCFVAKETVE